MRLAAIVLAVFLLSGCSFAQMRQEFLGYSISDVKTCKHKQSYYMNMDSRKCLASIKERLERMGAIVRMSKRKRFIVASNFQAVFKPAIDTTQAGILVTPVEKDKCRIDIASANTDLTLLLSKKLSEKEG